MKISLFKWLVAGCCGILAACAIITVNVYFPEKDVKEGYQSLDDMLLHQGDAKNQPAKPPPEPKAGEKPQSGLFPISVSLVTEAAAQERDTAETLAVEIAMMPDVLKAYDEMRARLPQLNALRNSGIVGETFQGLVSVRDKSKAAEAQPVVDAENRNRKTIITGMARAIIKIDKKQETPANMNDVLPKAAASYAATKKQEAKPGWWLLVAPDRWVQK
jgi:hypothetical protein